MPKDICSMPIKCPSCGDIDGYCNTDNGITQCCRVECIGIKEEMKCESMCGDKC